MGCLQTFGNYQETLKLFGHLYCQIGFDLAFLYWYARREESKQTCDIKYCEFQGMKILLQLFYTTYTFSS